MKTFKNLKQVVIGEVLYGVMFCVMGLVYDRLQYTYWDFSVLWDYLKAIAPITLLVVALTYAGYHLYEGIRSDIFDIKYRKVKEVKTKES